MNENLPKSAEIRVEIIIDWLKRHKVLLIQTDGVKLELNIKGQKVRGQVTNFPED